MKDALVQNAGDRQQVEKAKLTERQRKDLQLKDIATLLAMPEGRRFLWRLLGHCKVNSSVFDPHGSRLAYNSGMQDVGHFVLGEIVSAQPEAYLQMMQEAQQENA